MTTQLKSKWSGQLLPIMMASLCCAAVMTPVCAQEQDAQKHKLKYRVISLDSLGGTSGAGNSINDRTWVAGHSRLAGDQTRHATVWQKRRQHSLVDLGTLGGPNSRATWNVKNTECGIVGIH